MYSQNSSILEMTSWRKKVHELKKSRVRAWVKGAAVVFILRDLGTIMTFRMLIGTMNSQLNIFGP